MLARRAARGTSRGVRPFLRILASLSSITLPLFAQEPRPAAPPHRPPPVQIEWEAPAGCPSAENVSRELERLLAGWNKSGDAPLRARARASRNEAGDWRVEVTTDDGIAPGERILYAESCQAAADATALVVALAVAPELAFQPAAPPPKPPVPPPRPAGPKTDSPIRPKTRIEWIFGAQGLVATGRVPGLTSGVGLVIGLGMDRVHIELGATTWLPRNAMSPGGGSAVAELRSSSLDLRACYGPRFRRWSLAGCLGGRLAYLQGEGTGGPELLSASELQAGPLGGALVGWRLSEHWGLRAQTQLSVQALPRRDFLLYQDVVYKAPRLGADAALGLDLQF